MSHRFLAALVVLACAPPLAADWVTLDDGARLRGVDFTKGEKNCRFTLEDGRTVLIPVARLRGFEKEPAGARVEHQGHEVTLAEKIRLQKQEAARRLKTLQRAYERRARAAAESKASRSVPPAAAPGDPALAEADAALAGLGGVERERLLGAVVLTSAPSAARQAAASELGSFKTAHAAQVLAAALVQDGSKEVRQRATEALEANGHERAGDFIVPLLASGRESHRIRASQALERFPSRRSVPVLIGILSRIWSGAGRAFFFQGTQRAYIGDYELVSGGTGFSIVEVADPVVRTAQEGIVFDVHVRTVEERIHLGVLRRLSGEDFGSDAAAWRGWWNRQARAERERAAAGAKVGAAPSD